MNVRAESVKISELIWVRLNAGLSAVGNFFSARIESDPSPSRVVKGLSPSLCNSVVVVVVVAVVEDARWPQKPPWLFTTTREPKRVRLIFPAFKKHHQKSTKRSPERERKRTKWEWESKNRAKFWAVRRRGPAQGSPTTVFGCFGVLVFKVNDILEGLKGDQGRGPEMAKI